MKIGVRAHDYGKMEIERLAAVLHDEGYQAAQLALPKAFSGIDTYDDITPEHLSRIRRAFEDAGIDIPVFGCYMDLGNPDDAVRGKAVDTFKKCLTYCKEVGAKMVGTETAYPRLTAEEKKVWYPYMKDSIQRIAEEAQRVDAVFAVEPVYWHPLESIAATLDMLRTVNDPQHMRLIFDASNLLSDPSIDQDAFWNDWLEAIGSHIEAMHIKDFTLDADGGYVPALLGEGVIDYSAISRWLHENRPDMYLLREEMVPAHAQKDINFLKNL